MARHIPRIYTENLEDSEFDVSGPQGIHLVSVLRIKEGGEFVAFNKGSGEWKCLVIKIKKWTITAKKIELLREHRDSQKLCLAFCLVKQDDIKLIVEKATELGVTDLYPLVSRFSSKGINPSKLQTIITGASEQSERLDVPTLHEVANFNDFVTNLPDDILWIAAIERKNDAEAINAIDMRSKACGFIIGPAGGFAEEEKGFLAGRTTPVVISRNILRAETAAIACLSAYNAHNC